MKRPNILFILADDLGWKDLQVEGSDFYESPNCDRISQGGMRFSQGYAACQVCSPSRASILTGKYPTRHGITDWIGASSGKEWRKNNRFNKLLPPDYKHNLDINELTFSQVLQSQGYRTFFAGKWHLGDQGYDPENFGFEINKGGWKVGSPIGGYFSPWQNPKLQSGPAGESLPIRLARETSEFIKCNKNQPFLAYLSFYSVHGPIQTSKNRWEKFRQKAMAQGIRDRRFIFDRNLPVRQVQDCPIYAGMIEAMDEAIGLVLDVLQKVGVADNTIVCFTSDNGGVSSGDSFASSMLPLRGGKGRQWEGGLRVPYYIQAPGLVEAGSNCDLPVSGIDFYPTLLELADIPIPTKQVIDGESLVSVLRDEDSSSLKNRDLFWHYPHYGNQGGEPSSVIRSRNWKLIHYYEDRRDELYDLSVDQGEQNDLADLYTDKTMQMSQSLNEWLRLTRARLPESDPEYRLEKEKDRLSQLEHEFMPQLESQHAQYLDANWQPNADWWGSLTTID